MARRHTDFYPCRRWKDHTAIWPPTGSADRLVDPAGAQMLYDKTSSIDKTLKIYEGLYHEVFNEPERDRVLKDVENWDEAHFAG